MFLGRHGHYELLPEAMASDVMDDYLLAQLVHRIRQ